MTSREIVQRLIDDHIINGEEAFTLINDICKNEIYDVGKTLEGNNKSSIGTTGYAYPSTSAITADSGIYSVSASNKGINDNSGGI